MRRPNWNPIGRYVDGSISQLNQSEHSQLRVLPPPPASPPETSSTTHPAPLHCCRCRSTSTKMCLDRTLSTRLHTARKRWLTWASARSQHDEEPGACHTILLKIEGLTNLPHKRLSGLGIILDAHTHTHTLKFVNGALTQRNVKLDALQTVL